MKNKAWIPIVIIGIVCVVVAVYQMQQNRQAMVQAIPVDYTVVEVSWAESSQMDFVRPLGDSPIISYTLRCQLRNDAGEGFAETFKTEYPGCIVTAPVTTTLFTSMTLAWDYGAMGPLPEDWYEEWCKLHWLADDGQEHYGYIPGQGQALDGYVMVNHFYVGAITETYRCYMPLVIGPLPE